MQRGENDVKFYRERKMKNRNRRKQFKIIKRTPTARGETKIEWIF